MGSAWGFRRRKQTPLEPKTVRTFSDGQAPNGIVSARLNMHSRICPATPKGRGSDANYSVPPEAFGHSFSHRLSLTRTPAGLFPVACLIQDFPANIRPEDPRCRRLSHY